MRRRGFIAVPIADALGPQVISEGRLTARDFPAQRGVQQIIQCLWQARRLHHPLRDCSYSFFVAIVMAFHDRSLCSQGLVPVPLAGRIRRDNQVVKGDLILSRLLSGPLCVRLVAQQPISRMRPGHFRA